MSSEGGTPDPVDYAEHIIGYPHFDSELESPFDRFLEYQTNILVFMGSEDPPGYTTPGVDGDKGITGYPGKIMHDDPFVKKNSIIFKETIRPHQNACKDVFYPRDMFQEDYNVRFEEWDYSGAQNKAYKGWLNFMEGIVDIRPDLVERSERLRSEAFSVKFSEDELKAVAEYILESEEV